MHLYPQPAQGVLHQEAHDPVRGEELGSGRDVLRTELLLLPVEPLKNLGLFPFVEELVNPANGLIGAPGVGQVWLVEHLQKVIQRAGAGEEAAGEGVGVEEYPHLLGHLASLPEQEVAVGGVGVAPLVAGQIVGVVGVGQVELEGVGISTLVHRAPDQLAGLHHLEGHQPVEVGEGHFFDQLLHGLGAGQTSALFVVQELSQTVVGLSGLGVRLHLRQLLWRVESPVGIEAVGALKQLPRLAGQQLAGGQGQVVDGFALVVS